jgi:hypothetical protein
MRYVVLSIATTMAAFMDCSGGIRPYWSSDDAGHCLEHASPSVEKECQVAMGDCIDGGPPDTGANFLYMPCTQ